MGNFSEWGISVSAVTQSWDEFLDDRGNFVIECDGCDGLKAYEEAVKLLDTIEAESGASIRATYDLKSWPE